MSEPSATEPRAVALSMRDRPWRAASLAVGAGAGVFLLMANQDQVRHGTLYGLLLLLLCIGGLLRTLGLLRARGEIVPLQATAYYPLPGEAPWAAPRVLVPVACIALLGLGLGLGGHGLPWAIAIALLTLLPAALRRPGLLVFVVASLLYLPLLGTFGLWDPWETHYGEVSREILSRDDWISLWWAQDKWFWSKPIGIFWSEALAWDASAVGYLPDRVGAHVEWLLRLPIYVYSMTGLLAAYGAMAKVFGQRPALLGALVLATMPYYAMLTHQAITDMPCVGTMVAAVMMLLLAVHEDPEREVRSYQIGRLVISAHELVLGLLLLICLPQILYLASRNVTLVHGLFAWHRDDFLFGSNHNPDVPGNFGIHEERPAVRALWLEPLGQALLWAACVAFVVFRMRKERRAQPLYMLAFYLFCALSFMAKGAPGFALPGLIALLYLWSCNRWSLLFTGKLKVALGSLALLGSSLPWFVAMYVRHGSGFTDRLVIHDHLDRLASGVHGDTGSIQYFIAQLGYGTFPWIALAPLAFGGLLLRARMEDAADPDAQRRRDTTVLLGLWFAAAFTLYSAMITKFHHYVFPASPPLALLIGVLLDRMLGPPVRQAPAARGRVAVVFALLAPLPLVLGVAGLRGNVRGVIPIDVPAAQRATWVLQHGTSLLGCGALFGLGLLLLAVAWRLYPRPADTQGAGSIATAPALGAGLVAAAALCAFVGRDLSWTTSQRPAGNERLIGLFIYNYDRPFPDHLDYRAAFTGFAVIATALIALAALRALRPVLTLGLVGLSLWFTLFYLDVYMVDLTPHWSQRELVARYYRERKSAKEPLLAWQMNWKGENFYTGNRVAVFVDLNNSAMTEWIGKHKGTTAYFLLEHGRLARLKSLLSPRVVQQLSTERDNNKFVLVRALL
ncbi:MAG: glycosyltransferase family 39 protein [Polyangiales bacterium]